MRTKWAPALCVALIAAFMADLVLRPGGVHLTRSIDDVAEMLAAFAATAAAVVRARDTHGRTRVSWNLIGAGCAAWGVGEAIWCYYELIQGVDTPFPSWADAGYLVFPILALIGLLVRPSAAFAGQGRTRVTLDALLVSAALFLVSWVTALGQVYQAGADSRFAEFVSLAYPISDIVLLTVAVVVLSYARTGDRTGLLYIATGFVFLCVGDSGFAYLTAIGHYGAVNLIDAGWVGGFLVIATGAFVDRSVAVEADTMPIASRTALLLPYLPALAAVGAALHMLTTTGLDAVSTTAATVMIAALLGRQVLVLLDNRALMTHITHQAFHDVLTGLANRALFGNRLEHALDLHRRDLRPVTVLLLDLDDFKTVNDSLGHPAGDELLVRVSERLRGAVRTGDTVARLGGDEFAILMEDGGDGIDTAGRLLQSLDQPVAVAGRDVCVRASIGVATLDPGDHPINATEMLKRADVAMYAAKHAGKATAVRYSAALAGGDSQQLDMNAALMSAIRNSEIEVAYQPIHLADGRLRGFEALARWNYDGEPVSPAVFLPAAAKAGMLAMLDEVVLGKALRECAGWQGDIMLSVNLAGETLADLGFAARVDAHLCATGVPAARLAVEMLETSAIERDEAALTTVRALRGLGVRVTVDDFGAGYASLARLRALEPDVIKVDRSLLAAELDPDNPSLLLAGITDLGHRLGASVVAEGVETETQLAAAIAAGCDAVQGFLWGRPMTPEAARDLLDGSRTVPATHADVTAL